MLPSWEYVQHHKLHDLHILTPKFVSFLKNPHYFTSSSNKTQDLLSSVYLVYFRRVKFNDEYVLVYNYIRYHPFFYNYLNFFINSGDSIGSLSTFETGFSTFLVNRDLSVRLDNVNYYEDRENFEDLTKQNNDLIIKKYLRDATQHNFQDVLDPMLQFVMHTSKNEIINILILAMERENTALVKKIFTMQDPHKNWEINSSEYSTKYNNMINNFVVLTNDLKSMVKNLESKGYKVNQGPQSNRGQMTPGYHKLITLDTDFRISLMRNHYQRKNEFNKDSILTPDKFNFNNIHVNGGYVKL